MKNERMENKKIVTALTITILKTKPFVTHQQTFKRRSTTTKPRLVSYTDNGCLSGTNINNFVNKEKLLDLINNFYAKDIRTAKDFINAIGKCFPQQIERERNQTRKKFDSKYQLLDFPQLGIKILLRVSDHNINSNNITDDVQETYSIVIKKGKNKNTFVDSDDIEIKEFVFLEEKCDSHRYLLIAKQLYNFLENGEWDNDFNKADFINVSPIDDSEKPALDGCRKEICDSCAYFRKNYNCNGEVHRRWCERWSCELIRFDFPKTCCRQYIAINSAKSKALFKIKIMKMKLNLLRINF